MVAMFEIPRLPTPMATDPPGFTREAKGDACNCFATSPGISLMLRSGKFCLTSKRRDNSMSAVYQAHCSGGPPERESSLLLDLPLPFQHPRVLPGCEKIEMEV